MSGTRHLIPKPGLVVVRPDTLRKLPPKGEAVQMNSYWLRRLQDGDVAELVAKPAKPTTNTQPISQE